LAKYKSNY